LEKVTTKMCESCGKIEQAYQVALRKHQLPLITMRRDEPFPAYEYLHSVDEIYERLKEEIHNIQDPSSEVINKYVVDVAAVQLSLFVSTMIKSITGAFEAKIDCECDENNI